MGGLKKLLLEDDGFNDFLKMLVDNGHLEGSALGITKLVIDKGIESLSEKQKYVFDKEVIEEYTIDCTLCGQPIPWNEMYFALDSGMCSYCEHMHEKVMEELPAYQNFIMSKYWYSWVMYTIYITNYHPAILFFSAPKRETI